MADKYKEIGAILAAARRDRNKTLKEAEENTKIMASYLEAIEMGEPDKLPAVEYFMLFTRSYAQYLGVDPVIFDEIEESAVAEKSIARAAAREDKAGDEIGDDDISPRAQEKKFGKTIMYLVIGIVVVFAAFLVYTQVFMKSDESSAESLMSEPGDGDHESGGMQAARTLDITYPDQPWQPPDKLRLRMVAKQNVWAVVARDGDTVMNRELLAGQQRQWEANYRFDLTVGISSAVDLFLNDQKLRPLSDRARTIKDLEINQVNFAEFLPDEDGDQAPIMTTPAQEIPPSQPEAEEESWIERRPEKTTADTLEQETTTDTTPVPVEDDSWIEPPPQKAEPDTGASEAPDGG